MRTLLAILIGYTLLLATAYGIFIAFASVAGIETMLVPEEWRLRTWFAIVGPLLLVPCGLLAGNAAGRIGRRMSAGWMLAGIVAVGGMSLGVSSIPRRGDLPERLRPISLTESLRRVREPLPAMLAGPLVTAAAVLFGCGLGVTAGSRRRRPPASAPFHRSDAAAD